MSHDWYKFDSFKATLVVERQSFCLRFLSIRDCRFFCNGCWHFAQKEDSARCRSCDGSVSRESSGPLYDFWKKNVRREESFHCFLHVGHVVAVVPVALVVLVGTRAKQFRLLIFVLLVLAAVFRDSIIRGKQFVNSRGGE